MPRPRRWSKRRNQKVKHRIPHVTMIRAESELVKVPLGVLLADMDVG